MAVGREPPGPARGAWSGIDATESEEGWTQFFEGLKESGWQGVRLVVSDARRLEGGGAQSVPSREATL